MSARSYGSTEDKENPGNTLTKGKPLSSTRSPEIDFSVPSIVHARKFCTLVRSWKIALLDVRLLHLHPIVIHLRHNVCIPLNHSSNSDYAGIHNFKKLSPLRQDLSRILMSVSVSPTVCNPDRTNGWGFGVRDLVHFVCKVKFPIKHLVQDTLLAQVTNTFHSHEGLSSGSTRVWSTFHKYPDNQLSVFQQTRVHGRSLHRSGERQEYGSEATLNRSGTRYHRCTRLYPSPCYGWSSQTQLIHSSDVPRCDLPTICNLRTLRTHVETISCIKMSAAPGLDCPLKKSSLTNCSDFTGEITAVKFSIMFRSSRDMREESDQEKLFRRTPPVCPLSLLRFSGQTGVEDVFRCVLVSCS